MSLHVSLLILQYTLLCIVFVSNNLVAILRLVIPTKKEEVIDVDLCEDKELLYDDFEYLHLSTYAYIYIHLINYAWRLGFTGCFRGTSRGGRRNSAICNR